MDGNSTQQLQIDSQELQNAMTQAMREAIKALPRPQVPSWLETWVDFVRLHPLISLVLVLSIALIISMVIREIICSYVKTNDILARLRRIEQKLTEKTK